LIQILDSALFAKNHPGVGAVNSNISQSKLSQLQSPGSLWHAANPPALWAKDQNGSSEVHE